MIAQLFSSFIAACGFAVLFNVPKSFVLKSGFVGMIGWLFYFSLIIRGVDTVPASFIASFIVSFISNYFAKRYKTPVTIFIVGGIIPLVPGGLAYDAMKNFVINDYTLGIQLSVRVLLIAGAIAIGIMFSEVFRQIQQKIQRRTKNADIK